MSVPVDYLTIKVCDSSMTHGLHKKSGYVDLQTVPSITGSDEEGTSSDILRYSFGSQSQPLYAKQAPIADTFSSDKLTVTVVANFEVK